MTMVWGSSEWGGVFSRAPSWRARLSASRLELTTDGRTRRHALARIVALKVTPGFFWASLTIQFSDGASLTLEGIPNRQAMHMQRHVQAARTSSAMAKPLAVDDTSSASNPKPARGKRADQRQVATIKPAGAVPFGDMESQAAAVLVWASSTQAQIRAELRAKRWLSRPSLAGWLASRPVPTAALDEAAIKTWLLDQPAAARSAFHFWRKDLASLVDKRNQQLLRDELIDCAELFGRVESAPLTEAQARAVICFDQRLLLIAAAGSGKTSTLVAKAAYALHRRLLPAREILLLAFNADAATELGQRVHARLQPLGLAASEINTRTFHAFGLQVIEQVSGRRPPLAPWLEHGGDQRRLLELVDELKDRDIAFRTDWDLFRIVFNRELPPFGQERGQTGDWDRETRASGFRSLDGRVVGSQGERLIADWLFYNGVEYVHQALDAHHASFYYPAIGLRHDHRTLDPAPSAKGSAGSSRDQARLATTVGAAERLHTCTTELWSGEAFARLRQRMEAAGLRLDPDPDRPIQGGRVTSHEELARDFRAFLVHAKSQRLDDAELQQRWQARRGGRFDYRHALFLKLFATIRAAWERLLREQGQIDFEDMLGQAADHLESGAYASPYRLIMVDEFQDVSRARARLIQGLLRRPDSQLFAVGDDWQSINRFAGAEPAIMAQFEPRFGAGTVLRLERSFRCPQALCDIAGEFVARNPRQLPKQVVSSVPPHGPPLSVLEVTDDHAIADALRQQFECWLHALDTGELAPARDGGLDILLLGRYRRDRDSLPDTSQLDPRLRVRFLTIHGAKGLEADYVVLPRMVSGSLGFPSTISDDPLLRLVLPTAEDYPHAEERRLLYVALTRARRGVLALTQPGRQSIFLEELAASKRPIRVPATPPLVAIMRHTCRGEGCDGSMLPREGKYGAFLGCSRYPLCQRTERLVEG